MNREERSVKTLFLFMRLPPLNIFSPFTQGGGAVLYTPLTLFFCPLLKISKGNPFLKILELEDAPMKKK